MVRRCGGDATPPSVMVLFFSAHYENMGLGNSGESCDSGESANSIDFGDYGD